MYPINSSFKAASSLSLAQKSLNAWIFSFIERIQKIAVSCFTVIAYAFSTSRFSTKLLAELAVFDEEKPNEKLLIALAVLGVNFSLVEVSAPEVSHYNLPSKVSILKKAAYAKTPDLLNALLPCIDVNAVCSDFGDSLLHAAVYNALQGEKKWEDSVAVLLKKGADPNAKNDFGLTPLNYIHNEIAGRGEEFRVAYQDLLAVFSAGSSC